MRHPPPPHAIRAGIAWALAAGLCWGLAFVAPLILAGYHPIEITAGRFVGSGAFSLVMLVTAIATGTSAAATAGMKSGGIGSGRLWATAFGLALLGNFIYFTALTAGIQMANAAIVTLIIGLLPIAIPLIARLNDGTASVRVLALPSVMMLAGLLLVHGATHPQGLGLRFERDYLIGLALAVAALVSWTLYALANARVMARHPQLSASIWSSMQGVTLLPLSVPILAVAIMAGATHGGGDRASLQTFLVVSIVLGIATSWVATWCWNRASQLLPASLAGQLIVFETIASLVYVYLWYRAWPPLAVMVGATLLIGGVVTGVRRMLK